MAAYAASVTSEMKRAERITQNLGIFVGTVDISNYNSTLVEIEDITGKFKEVLAVFCSDVESAVNRGFWIAASGAIKLVVASTGSELADDQDAGEVDFVAIGFI